MVDPEKTISIKNDWIKKKTRDLIFLGKGPFGEVYSFLDEPTGKKRVLKIIRFEKCVNHPDINAWFDESFLGIEKIRMQLGSCKYISIFEDFHLDFQNQSLYLLNNLGQTTLSKYFQELEEKGRKMPLAKIKKLMQSILEGLQTAHSKNIAHGGIKPSNILISAKEEYLLTDWVFFPVDYNIESDFLQKKIKEKDLYMAPERINAIIESDKIDLCKVDTYAAGMLFLVCCGCPETAFQTLDLDQIDDEEDLTSYYFNKYIDKSRIPQKIMELIIRMTYCQSASRFTVGEALGFCKKNHIFEVLILICYLCLY